MKIEFTLVLASLKQSELLKLIEKVEEEIIERRAVEDGKNAAEWWMSSDMDVTQAEAILKQINDGDPEIMDRLPSPRLGGEFADEPSWESILRDESIHYDSEMDDDGRQDLQDLYHTKFTEASQDKIVFALDDFITDHATPNDEF